MSIPQDKKQELLKITGLLIGGYAAYKLLFTKKKPTVIAVEVIETPIKIVKTVAKHTKELIKDVADTFISTKDFKKAYKDVKFKVAESPTRQMEKKQGEPAGDAEKAANNPTKLKPAVEKKIVAAAEKSAEKRTQELEKEGMTRSDAQGVYEAEQINKTGNSDNTLYKNWLKTASDNDKKSLKNTSKIHKLTLEEAYFTTFYKPEKTESIVGTSHGRKVTIVQSSNKRNLEYELLDKDTMNILLDNKKVGFYSKSIDGKYYLVSLKFWGRNKHYKTEKGLRNAVEKEVNKYKSLNKINVGDL